MRALRQHRWLQLGAGLLTMLILSTIFLIPLNSDSDIYQSMAVDLLRYGKLPYLGSWDHNFPGIVYLHWLPLALFGNSDFSFRLLDLAVNVLTAYSLYRLTGRFTSPDLALLAPVTYAVYYVSGGWWAIGQRDVFAASFLLCAASLYASDFDSHSYWRHLLIGAMIGCAVIIRPTYGVMLPLLALRTFDLRRVTALALGCTIPFFLFLIGYTVSGGDLSELVLSVITYNTQAYGGLAEPWSKLLSRSPFQLTIFAAALVGIVYLLRVHRGVSASWALLALALTGLVSVVVMRKFFVYHFHVLFTALIALGVVGIYSLIASVPRPAYRTLLVSAMIVLMLIAFYPRHLLGIAARKKGSVTQKVQAVQSAFSMDSLFGRAIDLRLSQYLGREKNVELVSVTPAVHWMNELNRPSRFTMIHSLTTVGSSGRLTEFQYRWRAEYLSALQKRKPNIIALADGPAFLMKYIRRTPKDLALEIQGENGQLGFAQLLEQQYVLDTTIGGYYIYTRNAP